MTNIGGGWSLFCPEFNDHVYTDTIFVEKWRGRYVGGVNNEYTVYLIFDIKINILDFSKLKFKSRTEIMFSTIFAKYPTKIYMPCCHFSCSNTTTYVN